MEHTEYPMQAVAPTLSAVLALPVPEAAEAPAIGRVVEGIAGVSRVAVLGIDALGLAIHRRWAARMPVLNSLMDHRFVALRAILPSKTPVNFACMVTGANLDRHGVRTRDDAFQCETLFDVIRAAGKTSAGFGRRGYTGNELLGQFADLSAEGRAETDDEVAVILDETVNSVQPDFLIVQFGLTDDAFHSRGPYSPEAGDAAARADDWLAARLATLRAKEYGVLVLADHGQHPVEREHGTTGGTHGTDSDHDCLVPLAWTR
jgi:Type I phosphodiesterase / nucleotide pyrophosphatase